MAKLKSSPRPRARPTSAKTTAKRSRVSNTKRDGFTNTGSTGIGSGGGQRAPANLNERKRAQKEALKRPTVAPDNSLFLNRRGRTQTTGGGKGPNRLLPPQPGERAVRSLQSFNGPSKKRTVLGQ